MKAAPNQVYVYYSERERLYVAHQVVAVSEDGKEATLATLDWVGTEPPTETSLNGVPVLRPERFAYDGKPALRNVPNRVPRGWTLWGERPGPDDTRCGTFSGWSAYDMLAEHRWRAAPSEARRRYKEVRKGAEPVTLSGVTDDAGKPFALPAHTHQFREEDDAYVVRDDFDLSSLHMLPKLTRVRLTKPRATLAAWLAEAPLILTVELGQQGVPELDLRATSITELRVDATGLVRLRLPKSLDQLTLNGAVHPELVVEAASDGRWVTLLQSHAVPEFMGMDGLGGISLHGVRDVDVASLARRFPRLEQLRIWGAPATLSHVGALAQLSGLTELMLNDTFGFGAADFPTPAALPQLDELWLTSVPADVAAAVKKSYGKLDTLDVKVSKPRKPEWLAENLDNPFRDWDGREGITPANAKKAAKAYRALVSGVRGAVADHPKSGQALERAAGELVSAYIAVFNAADERTGFIETVEREEIIDALSRGLDGLPASISREDLLALSDRLRDF